MASQTPSYAGVVSMGAESRPGGPVAGQPGAPDWETYELPSTEGRPEFDETKVQSLAQQHAAPGIRTLREAYQTAASRLPSDPRSRLTLKDALKGYGSGLESVMGGARKTARAEEMQKFSIESKNFATDYAAKLQQARDMAQLENARLGQQWQADYAEFMDEPEEEEDWTEQGLTGRSAYYAALLGQ